MTTVEKIIDHMLPFVRTAGAYALEVQSRVQQLDLKEQYDNLFGQALTAADVSVQNYIEVSLLSSFPDIYFFGEEVDKSYNANYFNQEGSLAVYLDPIDGTRYYMDGHQDFNIILSFLDETGYVGALVHVPYYGVSYIAHQGGAFIEENGERRPYRLDGGESNIVTYNVDAEFIRRAVPAYHVVDVNSDYKTEDPCLSTNSILQGGSSAIIATHCSVIDWGVFGYLVEKAGGQCRDFENKKISIPWKKPEYAIPELIICVDEKLCSSLTEAFCSQRS